MAKYLRKLFIISRIRTTILILKNNPTFLIEILKLINTPIIHKFTDPVDNKIIDETDTKEKQPDWIRFLFFIFTNNINFTKNKGPQKGRIKRKILRKLVIENKIVD
jgi:hypothetical protein